MSRTRHPRGAMVRALTPIVRRLHIQELPRLRHEAARLADEAEYYRNAFYDECRRSEMFHEALMQAEDIEVGLTRGGELLVAPSGIAP